MASVLKETAPEVISIGQLLDLPFTEKLNDENTQEEDKFSMWIEYGDEYVPATNLKTVDKLPSGVYKVIFKNDDYRVVPVKINTDELYRFSEDFTDVILKEADKFWERAPIYKQYNIVHKRGIMLAGPPGSGR